MSGVYVLDACALIASLKNESGADIVDAAYEKANQEEIQLLMNKINLFEVYYGFYHESGIEYAKRIMDAVRQSVVTICDFTDSVFSETGRLKASYKIS